MKSWKLALAVGLLSLGSTAQAALIMRSAGMVYDDVLNITWAPANLWGQTGNWQEALDWADQLVYAGFDDWRLASMSVSNLNAATGIGATDDPVNCLAATEEECRDNELAYNYYYNLTPAGETPPTVLSTDLTGDQDPFTGIRPHYYSGTEYATEPLFAWAFLYDGGYQGDGAKVDDTLYDLSAWAVRAGDVAAAPVPGTALLMALGLLGLGAGRQKRRATWAIR